MSRVSSLLKLPLRIAPAAVGARVGALLCNHLLRGQPFVGRLCELDGRVIAIDIADVPTTLSFRIDAGRLHAAVDRTPDVVIRSDIDGFLQLAMRREDPDTLFFQRRLCIEGDTDTGVHIKNLLDAQEFDWELHFRAVLPAPLAQRAVRALHRLRSFKIVGEGHARY